MKAQFIILLLLSLSFNLAFGQEKNSGKADDSFVDAYFTTYAKMPGYDAQMMGEAMVKRLNDKEAWKHPSIARIMKQVKTYKNLSMPVTPEFTSSMLEQLDQQVKKDQRYDQYYRKVTANSVVIIYTRGKQLIKEIAVVSIAWGRLTVSSFIGDQIDLESVRALSENR